MKKVYLYVSLLLMVFIVHQNGADVVDDEDEEESEPAGCLAFDYFKKLDAGPANVVVSPLGIDWCLSMLMAGADGQTSEEISKVAGTEHMTNEEIRKQFNSKLQTFRNADSNNLSLDTSLVYNYDVNLKQEYQDNARKNYFCDLYQTNFEKDPHDSAKWLNKWVDSASKGTVKDMLNVSQEMDDGNDMIITNVATFKGLWASGFDKSKTEKGTFHNVDGSTSQVMFMKQQGPFKYYKDTHLNAEVIEMYYAGRQMSCVFIVPLPGNTVDSVLKKLTCENYMFAIQNAKYCNVNVKLPKLQMESQVGPQYPLQQMGMNKAFTTEAEFPGIDKDTFVSDAIQQTMFSLDEQGESSAAGNTSKLTNVNLDLDRSFMFVIQHIWSGNNVMIGTVNRLPTYDN